MQYQVSIFHMTTTGFRNAQDRAGRMNRNEAPSKVLEGMEKGYYLLCAQVGAESLEDAYKRTQNDFFENGWAQGDTVTWAAQHQDGKNRQRSSMVGDIFLFDANAYVVAMMGFTRLPEAIAYKLSEYGFTGKTGTAFDDAL